MKALLEFVAGQLFTKRLEHEFAQGLSTSARTLPKPAMNILRNILDLKVRHCMTIACPKHCTPNQNNFPTALERLDL